MITAITVHGLVWLFGNWNSLKSRGSKRQGGPQKEQGGRSEGRYGI